MGNIHFIGGEKGGVGKSLTARLLAQFYIDKGQSFMGFDLDQSHGTFSRFYGEFTTPLQVDNFDSLDRLVVAAESYPDANIIIDLAAQTSSRLEKWIAESGVIELLDELGFRVFIWHVMDDGADSLRLLDRLLDNYATRPVQFVAVRNLGRGEDFSGFDTSAALQRLKQANAHVVTLNRLQTSLAQKIDFNNYSFWAAANNAGVLSTVERQRVKVWLGFHIEQLNQFLQPEPVIID